MSDTFRDPSIHNGGISSDGAAQTLMGDQPAFWEKAIEIAENRLHH